MSHTTLENYYKNIFSLVYHHKFNIDIENMIPFERDLYINMIQDHMEKVREANQAQQNIRNKLERSGKI